MKRLRFYFLIYFFDRKNIGVLTVEINILIILNVNNGKSYGRNRRFRKIDRKQ